jgi:hypothetical protein
METKTGEICPPPIAGVNLGFGRTEPRAYRAPDNAFALLIAYLIQSFLLDKNKTIKTSLSKKGGFKVR